jgi:hypothetical protein
MTAKIKRLITNKQIRQLHAIYRKNRLGVDQKKDLILNLTDGRTDSTKDLSYSEAVYLCGFLNGRNGVSEKPITAGEREIKRRRSGALKRMQLLGIETTSWHNINTFCCDKRIMGKPFYDLTPEELLQLIKKLEIIINKRIGVKNE